MAVVLNKEAYTIDSTNLYRVSVTVDGKCVKQTIQCFRTQT